MCQKIPYKIKTKIPYKIKSKVYKCYCQECGDVIPLAEGETPEEQKEWFNEEDELKLCFDCEEDDKEQCVGLYDGACVGKKIYKSSELDLGMCQECYDYMDNE
jgi:hypothetical protein